MSLNLFKVKIEVFRKQTFFQRRHTDKQQIPAKMLNTPNPQGNANQITARYHFMQFKIGITKRQEIMSVVRMWRM